MAQHRAMKRVFPLEAVVLVLLSCSHRVTAVAPEIRPSTATQSGPLALRLIAFNDVHGHLEPEPSGPGAPPAHYGHGGVTSLAREVRTLRAQVQNAFVVSAGDLFGASPLLSSMFEHVPTVSAMNALGLDVAGVGNHEFDRGPAALKTALAGAKFEVLGANVSGPNGAIFPAYTVKEVEGVPVAFIGLTTRDTRSLVLGERIVGINFGDEAKAVNDVVAQLRPRGIEAFVVLIHEGGTQHGGLNDCNGLKGRIGGIVAQLSPAVDVIVSGHTHAAYNCVLSGKPVTSALSYARMVTRIDLTLDRATHEVTQVEAENRVVPDGPQDAAVLAAIAPYQAKAAPVVNRIVGRVTATVHEHENADGESELGSLVADAQWEATRAAGAEFALVNAGGLRNDLPYVAERGGALRYAEVHAAQPFGNALVTMSISGKALMRAVSAAMFDGQGLIQVSNNVAVRWSGGKLVSMTVNGTSVAEEATYRVTVNEYMAGLSPWKSGSKLAVGISDTEALVAFLVRGAVSPTPAAAARIKKM